MKINRGFAPILIILILVAVGGIGLYAEKQARTQKKETPKQEQKDTKPEVVSKDESVVSGGCGIDMCTGSCYDISKGGSFPQCAIYATVCMKNAKCERQWHGGCGWTGKPEWTQCTPGN